MEEVSKPARRLRCLVSFGRIVGEAIEAATAHAETLAANRFTAADIVVGYALWLADRIGLGADFGPDVAAYWQRLQQRDGYKRALAAEESEAQRQKVAAGVFSN